MSDWDDGGPEALEPGQHGLDVLRRQEPPQLSDGGQRHLARGEVVGMPDERVVVEPALRVLGDDEVRPEAPDLSGDVAAIGGTTGSRRSRPHRR